MLVFRLGAKHTCCTMFRSSFSRLAHRGSSFTSTEEHRRVRTRCFQNHVVSIMRLMSSNSKVHLKTVALIWLEWGCSLAKDTDWQLSSHCVLTGARVSNVGTSTRASTPPGNTFIIVPAFMVGSNGTFPKLGRFMVRIDIFKITHFYLYFQLHRPWPSMYYCMHCTVVVKSYCLLYSRLVCRLECRTFPFLVYYTI